MGAKSTGNKVPSNLSELCEKTQFRPNDIKKIYNCFLELDKSNKGYVSSNDFIQIKEINQNPLQDYIVTYLKKNKKSDEINFDSFLYMLDIFEHCPSKQKNFLFDLIDTDKDGKITDKEFIILLEYLFCGQLEKSEFQFLADSIAVDTFSNKSIGYDEFSKLFD